MANDNVLGFCSYLEDRINSNISNLEESVAEIMKSKPVFKAIKSVKWELNLDPELGLWVNVSFRDGSSLKEIFTSHVDESSLELNSNELEAYFNSDKVNKIKKYLDNGVLDSNYLKAHEPRIFSQLSQLYLLDCAPNTYNGAEFTTSDEEFFIKIIQKHQ